MVECHLAKVKVASSNLVSRSIDSLSEMRPETAASVFPESRRRSQVVRQRSAKPLFIGSIPIAASIYRSDDAETYSRRLRIDDRFKDGQRRVWRGRGSARLVPCEKTREYRGVCHVLHGVLSPIRGIDEVKEVNFATNPNTEVEATANYIVELLRRFGWGDAERGHDEQSRRSRNRERSESASPGASATGRGSRSGKLDAGTRAPGDMSSRRAPAALRPA